MGAGAGIEPITEGIAEKVEGEHGDHHGECGENDQVRGVEEMAARVDRTVALRYE